MTRVTASQRRGARSTHWLALAAAALALLLWSQPAAGQYGPPAAPPPRDYPNASPSPRAPDAAAPQSEVLRAAACLVGRDAGAAERLLATAPHSNAERTEAARLLRLAQRCLRSREAIATSPLALRGAVAESLLEARFAESPAARDPAVAAPPWFRPEAATARDDAAALAPVYALADCSAAHSPALARALLAAEPGAAAEGEALGALGPVWIACAPPGAQLALDRGAIRAILAEALYRWSVVQRDGAGSP